MLTNGALPTLTKVLGYRVGGGALSGLCLYSIFQYQRENGIEPGLKSYAVAGVMESVVRIPTLTIVQIKILGKLPIYKL
ncbi:hypothetical protein DID80_03985 [Candidatus Marinamargulisbacteria bacterium SCGC AAA071-K20]|nr:hypothetical protein DID80_03985 [Candidatus Marinamargulisbacteria bacterium SCGC AAA071-K20]